MLEERREGLDGENGFQRYAMYRPLRRNLAIGGAVCVIVIALIVGVLRPKHASVEHE
jgi:hypothetical protein